MRNFFPLFFIILASCADNDSNPSVPLEGKWVAVEVETDTLIFDADIGRDIFQLKRGKEIQNGYLLPKSGAGIYEFKINGESISIYNMVSSCYCFNDYFFNQSGYTLIIENFYEKNAKGDLKTFRKLN